jgi:hypothetical protein
MPMAVPAAVDAVSDPARSDAYCGDRTKLATRRSSNVGERAGREF